MIDRTEREPNRDYAHVGMFRRFVRRTAATRPMTWLYIRIQRRTDQLVFRLTRGHTTASSLLSGLPVAMLTTTGARTGRRHTVPVLGFSDSDRLVVIASNYGRAAYPAWYHNLRANPDATVTVNRVTKNVQARELTGDERDEWFDQAAQMYPGFVTYERRATDRRIPVLTLDPT